MTFSVENIRENAKKVFIWQVTIGVVLCFLGTLWDKSYLTSLLVGAVTGCLDGFIFLRSVVRGMTKAPQGAFRGMRMSMLVRIVVLLLMALFLQKTGGNFLPAVICYLCLHVALMFNMTLFTKKK